jgi:hypothetical protein
MRRNPPQKRSSSCHCHQGRSCASTRRLRG